MFGTKKDVVFFFECTARNLVWYIHINLTRRRGHFSTGWGLSFYVERGKVDFFLGGEGGKGGFTWLGMGFEVLGVLGTWFELILGLQC